MTKVCYTKKAFDTIKNELRVYNQVLRSANVSFQKFHKSIDLNSHWSLSP